MSTPSRSRRCTRAGCLRNGEDRWGPPGSGLGVSFVRVTWCYGRLTIQGSAASEASPLQPVVGPTFGEKPNRAVMMRGPSWPKWVGGPRCTNRGVESWRCPRREPRLAACRLSRPCRRGPFALDADGPRWRTQGTRFWPRHRNEASRAAGRLGGLCRRSRRHQRVALCPMADVGGVG